MRPDAFRKAIQLSDLGVQGLHNNVGLRLTLGSLPENTACSIKKLVAPLLDLVWVHVEFLRRLARRLLTLGRKAPPLSP